MEIFQQLMSIYILSNIIINFLGIMEKKNDFQNLFSKCKEAFPNTNLGELQKQCIAFWNSIKFSEDFKNKLNAKLQELVGIIRKRKAKLDMFWANVNKINFIE